MGRYIIKQPNGKYCVFNSVIDNVTDYDMTVDDIIEDWLKETRDEIVEKVKSIISKLESGVKPYYNNSEFTYNEMIAEIENIHGVEEMKKIKDLIEPPQI